MAETIVQVEHLRKEFDGTVAVADVSFTVPRGEIVGVLGQRCGEDNDHSGSARSDDPTSGTVRVFGQDLEKHRVEILQRCNFSSAYTGLPSNLKVWENLLIFRRLWRQGSPGENETVAGAVRDRPSSDQNHRSSLVGRIDPGQSLQVVAERSRIADARRAHGKPRSGYRRQSPQVIASDQREKGITMVYTSHNMRDVEEVCDRVLFLNKGRIIAEGTPQQVKDQFNQKSLEDVFISVARSGDVETRDGEEGGK